MRGWRAYQFQTISRVVFFTALCFQWAGSDWTRVVKHSLRIEWLVDNFPHLYSYEENDKAWQKWRTCWGKLYAIKVIDSQAIGATYTDCFWLSLREQKTDIYFWRFPTQHDITGSIFRFTPLGFYLAVLEGTSTRNFIHLKECYEVQFILTHFTYSQYVTSPQIYIR